VWIDGLVMRRFPVTNAEFIQFLNTLLDEGDEEAALRYEPRFEGHSVHVRGPDGRFKIREGQRRYPMTAEMPANMVDWQAARAYASYEQRRTGQPWTLPGDLEWEKAARGVDGRRLPWGDTMDATFYNMRDSRPSHPFPTPVDSFPVDESPYGVRGLAGNIMDWCRDPYRTGGPPLERGRVTDRWEAQIRAQAEPTAARVVRGGHWYGVAHIGLAAHRYRLEPSFTGYLIGMRLSRRF
jgi:serine/threonine-protein kinase